MTQPRDAYRPDLSVCVAVYKTHGPPNLDTLLQDLPEAAEGRSYEVVVALNGIRPGLIDRRPEVQVVEHERNRGVTVGWNSAAEAARGRTLVIINDDVRLGRGALRMLADALQNDPAAGVVGPVGTHWDISQPAHLSYVDVAGQPLGSVVSCDVLSGFLMATRRDTWVAAGGFDPAYTPCSFEEVDFCTTVKVRLGLSCQVVVGVPFEHEFAISAKRPWRRIRWDGKSESLGSIARRNRAYFRDKWSGTPQPTEATQRS